MTAQWYCTIGQQTFGPMTPDQLKNLVMQGQLLPTSPVRFGANGAWMQAATVRGLFSGAPSVGTTASPLAALPTAAPAQPIQGGPPLASPPLAPPTHPPTATPLASATPQTPLAVPVGVPTGTPVAATPPQHAAVPPAQAPGSAPAPASSIRRRRSRRRSDQGLLVAVLVCLAGVVLIGIVGLAVFLSMPDEGTEQDKVARASPAADEKSPADAAAGRGRSAAMANDPQRRLQIVKSIAKWSDAERVRSVGLKGRVRLQVSRAWLASNPSGTQRVRVDGDAAATADADPSAPADAASAIADTVGAAPKAAEDETPKDDAADDTTDDETTDETDDATDAEKSDETDDAPADEKPPVPPAAKTPTRFVFIEVYVTNENQTRPLDYTSWNGAGDRPDKTSAILVDDAGNLCDLAPYAVAPGRARRRFVKIGPAEEITDLLVFRAPPGSFKHLRLVLPYAAVGYEGTKYRYVGFQLSKEMLEGRASTPSTTTPGGDKRDPDQPDIGDIERGIEEVGGGDQPQDDAKPKTPAPKTDDPVQPGKPGKPDPLPPVEIPFSREDFDRQIEESGGGDKDLPDEKDKDDE